MENSDFQQYAYHQSIYTLVCPLCKTDLSHATLSDLEVGLKMDCPKCGLSIQLDR